MCVIKSINHILVLFSMRDVGIMFGHLHFLYVVRLQGLFHAYLNELLAWMIIQILLKFGVIGVYIQLSNHFDFQSYCHVTKYTLFKVINSLFHVPDKEFYICCVILICSTLWKFWGNSVFHPYWSITKPGLR